MALDIENPEQQHRSIGVVTVGVIVLAIGGALIYHLWKQSTDVKVDASIYSYSITQSVKPSVTYFPSSFYGDGPGAGETAYVAAITKEVSANLKYEYKASRNAQLTATYSAQATVYEDFATGTDTLEYATAWSEQFPLIKPVTATYSGTDIVLSPEVTIPYAEYREMADRYMTALAVPVVARADIVFTVRVAGTVDGASIDDVRVSTVSMLLDQPMYTISNKFDKEDTKQVTTQMAKEAQDKMRTYERIAAAALTIIGAGIILYGMRKQILKSSYQRELEKIYRYHDGIIIRARRPANLKNKNVVTVQSFDDLLNLEEELKVPIVASPAGAEATHFIIIRDDVLYVYTLGKLLLDEEVINELGESVEEEIESPKPLRRKHKKVQ